MSTNYNVMAYFLGTSNEDGGKEESKAEAVTLVVTDVDNDGMIREDGDSGSGDMINGHLVDKLGNNSKLTLSDGTVVRGWYLEFTDKTGNHHLYFVPTDGTIPEDDILRDDIHVGGKQNSKINEATPAVPCFTAGSLILTATGYKPVEDIRQGDLVQTRDCGFQAVRWVGQRALTPNLLQKHPELRPISIKRGAFGNDIPNRDIAFSPNHRILISSYKAQLLFGEHEVLSAIKTAQGTSGVTLSALGNTTYVHLLFDSHQLVLTDGMWTESFLPAPKALKSINCAQRREIFSLFPELKEESSARGPTLARPELKSFESRLLL